MNQQIMRLLHYSQILNHTLLSIVIKEDLIKIEFWTSCNYRKYLTRIYYNSNGSTKHRTDSTDPYGPVRRVWEANRGGSRRTDPTGDQGKGQEVISVDCARHRTV